MQPPPSETQDGAYKSLSPKAKDRIVGWGIGALCATPAIWLIYALLNNQLGVNPVEAFVRQSGLWGLRLLLVTLAASPLARILRQPWLIRHRRTIGLWAFALITMHLLSFVVIDQELDWREIVKSIVKRPFITIGMAAWLMLIPLSITSLDKIRRKLGPKKWRRLHQSIYVIIALGSAHYYLLVKADHGPPVLYAGIASVLLAWRLASFAVKRRRVKSPE